VSKYLSTYILAVCSIYLSFGILYVSIITKLDRGGTGKMVLTLDEPRLRLPQIRLPPMNLYMNGGLKGAMYILKPTNNITILLFRIKCKSRRRLRERNNVCLQLLRYSKYSTIVPYHTTGCGTSTTAPVQRLLDPEENQNSYDNKIIIMIMLIIACRLFLPVASWIILRS
jgi:hypothetical protein